VVPKVRSDPPPQKGSRSRERYAGATIPSIWGYSSSLARPNMWLCRQFRRLSSVL